MKVGNDFYGITRLGGSAACGGLGCGTVFRLAGSGNVTTLFAFPQVGGSFPEAASLVYHDGDAALYGVMRSAAPCGPQPQQPSLLGQCGAIFRLAMNGDFRTLFSFSGSLDEGSWPLALLVGNDGHLYGATATGGIECVPGFTCGTVFRVTLLGDRTTLHAFEGGTLGASPNTLVLGSDGDLYGTMSTCFDTSVSCDRAFRIALGEPPLANLRMKSFTAPARAAAGATITLRDSVANAGDGPSSQSSTTYAWSANGSLLGATPLGGRNLPQLGVGSTSAGQLAATLPEQPGIYTLFAWADSAHLVQETREYDNVKGRDIIVGPDLQSKKIFPLGGSAIELSPAAPTSATPTTINVYTANVGGGTAGPSVTRLYRSKRGVLSDAVLLAEFGIGAVGSLEHHHSTVSLLLPPGDYFLLAVVDATQQVTEAREGTLFKLRVSVALDLRSHLLPNNGRAGSLTAGPDHAVWFSAARCEDPGCVGPRRHESIGRITADGAITEFPLPLTDITAGAGTYGVTTGPDNALWFTQIRGNNIGRLTTAGALTLFPLPPTLSNPYLITSGPDGALWFTASDAIGRITTAGVVTRYPLPSNSTPVKVVTGPDGALWFSMLGRNTIGRMTTLGVLTERTLPPSCMPLGLAVGADAALWFTCLGGNTIGRLTLAGAISTFGCLRQTAAPPISRLARTGPCGSPSKGPARSAVSPRMGSSRSTPRARARSHTTSSRRPLASGSPTRSTSATSVSLPALRSDRPYSSAVRAEADSGPTAVCARRCGQPRPWTTIRRGNRLPDASGAGHGIRHRCDGGGADVCTRATGTPRPRLHRHQHRERARRSGTSARDDGAYLVHLLYDHERNSPNRAAGHIHFRWSARPAHASRWSSAIWTTCGTAGPGSVAGELKTVAISPDGADAGRPCRPRRCPATACASR